MDLPGNLLKSEGRVQHFPDLVLIERLNARMGHSLLGKIKQCMLNQAAATSAAPVLRVHGKIRYIPNAGQSIAPAGDVAYGDPVRHKDKYPLGLPLRVQPNMIRFPGLPVHAINNAVATFNIPINGDGTKRIHRDLLEPFKVIGPKCSYHAILHVHPPGPLAFMERDAVFRATG